MTKAAFGELLDHHLGHQFGPQGHPTVVPLGRPAVGGARHADLAVGVAFRVGPLGPGVGLVLLQSVGLQQPGQLDALGGLECGRHAHVLQRRMCAVFRGVVETQHHRAHPVARLVNPISGHHHVHRVPMFHLDEAALVLLVGTCGRLGHHPVKPSPLKPGEPVAGNLRVVGDRRQVHGRGGAIEQGLQCAPPLRKRHGAQVELVECQQVEGHQRGRCLRRQPFDAAFRRVDPVAQHIEVQTVEGEHDQLAVDDASLRQLGQDRIDQLWEVTGQRLLPSRCQLHLIAVSKHQAAVAVPLGLVQQPLGLGHGRGGLGQHRLDRWHHRQLHVRSSPDRHQNRSGQPRPGSGCAPSPPSGDTASAHWCTCAGRP